MKSNPALENLRLSLIQQMEKHQPGKDHELDLEAMLQTLQNLPFPGTGHEEWKYSPFQPPKNIEFSIRQELSSAEGILPDNKEQTCWKLIFIDGIFQETFSQLPNQAGISFQSLNERNDWQAPYETTLFSELNRFTGPKCGLSIQIDSKAEIELPIILEHRMSPESTGAWIQPRIQIRLGKGAKASFAETWQIPSTDGMVINSVSEIHQEEGSQLFWTNLENGLPNLNHIHQTRIFLEKDAFCQHLQISLGEGYFRNNLEIKVGGTGADAHMYGLTIGDKKLHVDNHTFINHREENTTSNQLYKTIMAGKSTAVFNGKILVEQKAQKTNAYQSSKNLLLSAEAKVYAKPQLEIFADDVKCSHGATIGQLDEEPVFYLRSRGLDEAAARKLMMHAFAAEILEKEPNEWIRAQIKDQVNTAFQELHL